MTSRSKGETYRGAEIKKKGIEIDYMMNFSSHRYFSGYDLPCKQERSPSRRFKSGIPGKCHLGGMGVRKIESAVRALS